MTYRSTLVQGPEFQGVDAEGAALIVMGAYGHADREAARRRLQRSAAVDDRPGADVSLTWA